MLVVLLPVGIYMYEIDFKLIERQLSVNN